MGGVCCRSNVDGQGQLNGNMENILNGKQKQSVQQEDLDIDANKPAQSIAKPYLQKIEFPPEVDQRSRELGPFQYPSDRSIPKGQMLGSYKLNNGTIFTGEWKKGSIHGKGVYVLPNKTIIYCMTNENHIVGKGRVIYPNGDYFEGEIVNGKAEGKGKYTEGNVTFSGQFNNNLQDGFGVEKGENYFFEGIFQEGVKKQGKLNWIDSEPCEYMGEFLDNCFEGRGTLVSKEGKYIGNFSHGLKNGQGKLFYKDKNQYYQGEFFNGKRHGQGILVDEIEGKVIQKGTWENDTLLK